MAIKRSYRLFFWIAIVGVLLFGTVWIFSSSADEVPGDLIINEFLASNATGLTDEDGDYSDWIEIYNRSSQPVNLSGWALTDDLDQPAKWPFPAITLGSYEYLVVFASGKNRSSTESDSPLQKRQLQYQLLNYLYKLIHPCLFLQLPHVLPIHP